MTKVVVLMSTHNGARFIEAQMRSILDQLPAAGRILIRDDGSTDDTLAELERFQDDRISLIHGQNLGVVGSYFALMRTVPNDADVIMFSDQDDIWLPGKIERACSHLKGKTSKPTLYASRLQLVDMNLVPTGLSPEWPRGASFANALTQNILTGCTMAFNRPALEKIIECGEITDIILHDWWAYLVVTAYGDVIFDNQPTILYRQHAANAQGMVMGMNYWRFICRSFRQRCWSGRLHNQIVNFYKDHGSKIARDDRALIERFFDFNRPVALAQLAFARRQFRQSLVGECLFRLVVLTEWITRRASFRPLRLTGHQKDTSPPLVSSDA